MWGTVTEFIGGAGSAAPAMPKHVILTETPDMACIMQPVALCSLHNESYPMQHARLATNPCPIARGLDRVGDWWSILILRDAFHGKTRFDQFQTNLGIAPNILSRRLRKLVEAGLLTKVRYSPHPPRDEYRLTPVGEDFRPVLRALLVWSNTHFTPKPDPAIRSHP